MSKETVVTGFAPTTAAAETAATKQTAADGMAALRAQLAANATGFHFHTGEHMINTYAEKAVNFVTAKNGIFRVTVKKIGMFVTKIGDAPKSAIPGLVDLKEGFTIRIPKIPFLHWVQILSFYRDVYTKDKTEASVLFFWNHDNTPIPRAYESGKAINGILENGQLVIFCPEQRNSGGLSEFHMDGMVKWLRENTTPLCETHSHHTMGAFWSGTDDANENMTQLYGVYGTITSPSPAFLFRYVHGADKTNISMWELFEKPTTRVAVQVELGDKIIDVDASKTSTYEYNGPWPMVDYPDDWMGQHTANTYVAPKYQGGTYYQGGYAGRGGATHTHGTGGANRGTYTPSREDLEEAAWWNQTGHGANYEHQARTQRLEDVGTGKKNTVIELPIGKKSDSLVDQGTKKVVETKTSTVEIISSKELSPWVETQLSDLVDCLSDAGYDRFIAKLLQKTVEISG
jgi:hypothetical protein